MNTEWISIADASGILGVSRYCVGMMVRKRLLKARRIPGCQMKISRSHAEQIARAADSDSEMAVGHGLAG